MRGGGSHQAAFARGTPLFCFAAAAAGLTVLPPPGRDQRKLRWLDATMEASRADPVNAECRRRRSSEEFIVPRNAVFEQRRGGHAKRLFGRARESKWVFASWALLTANEIKRGVYQFLFVDK
ncbi:hypothetical protein MRX96_040393 [Rhipicephalus microplus]